MLVMTHVFTWIIHVFIWVTEVGTFLKRHNEVTRGSTVADQSPWPRTSAASC